MTIESMIRRMAISMLSDRNGINGSVWDQLQIILIELDDNNQDIIDAAKQYNGRFHISREDAEKL